LQNRLGDIMKKLIKKLFIFVLVIGLVVAGLHAGLFVFINFKGKEFLATSIKKNFDVEATVESLSLKFPFNVEINNFKCVDVSFKKANVILGLQAPLQLRVVFDRVYIEGLELKVVKARRGLRIRPFLRPSQISPEETPEKKDRPEAKKEGVSEYPQTVEPKIFPFKIGKLQVKKGRVDFSDRTTTVPFRVIAEDLNLKVKNIRCPELTKMHIVLKSSLRTETGVAKDTLNLKGWVDYFHKNMDVDLTLDSVDYFLFSKYYPPFWRPQTLSIKEARLSLASNMHSENNDLLINSTLTLDKIEFIESEEDLPRRDMAKTIVALLKGDKEKASLNFTIKTKMDSPVFDLSSLQESFKTAVPLTPGMVVKGVVGKTKKKVSEGVDDVKGVAGEAVDKAVDAIKGLVDEMKDIFKPSENTQPQE
jgi:hypothetical protein